jgi:hypothetical protein
MRMLKMVPPSKRKVELLDEMQELLEQRKILKARNSFKDFCEYVIKDERSGEKIAIAELQKSWIDHIGFCKNHGINALILAPMGHGKCVAPDTKFITPQSEVKATDLRAGQQVLSYAHGKIVWTDIVAVEVQPAKEVYSVKFDSGRQVICTHDHKFLCENKAMTEWIVAEDLVEGDNVVTPTNWAVASSSTTDYYWYGLQYFSKNIIRYNLDRLLDNLNLTEYSFNRTKLERDSVLELECEELSPFSFCRQELTTFIDGVLDGIGNYNVSLKMYEIELDNREGLETLQTLMQSLGLQSRLVRRIRPRTIKYSLLINKLHSPLLTSMFKCELTDLHKDIHRKLRFERMKDYMFDKVVSMTSLGHQPTIGVETGNHTHVTGGVVTHNTQIVSVALPLYLLGKDPSTRIKMVCLADDAGKERMSSIKAYLSDDADYAKVFPSAKKDKDAEWSKRNLTLERPTLSKDPSLSVKGVTSGGIGGRCDILLVDDIFDYKTAIAQPATREQICSTFKLVWMSRIDEGGMAVVICTRWHERDLAGEILSEPLMRDQYGVLIQSISPDFSGVDIQVVLPNHLEEEYMRCVPGFYSSTNPITALSASDG